LRQYALSLARPVGEGKAQVFGTAERDSDERPNLVAIDQRWPPVRIGHRLERGEAALVEAAQPAPDGVQGATDALGDAPSNVPPTGLQHDPVPLVEADRQGLVPDLGVQLDAFLRCEGAELERTHALSFPPPQE
jgi:hypothetical protein